MHNYISVKYSLLTTLLLLFLSACTPDVKPEEMAVQAAKAYYDQMLQGDYESFVAGTEGYDSVPDYYHEQLIANMKMFVGQQKAEHNGIVSVTALNAKVDTVKLAGEERLVAEAFLSLCYGDSTRESVVVPMIEKNGIWKMR